MLKIISLAAVLLIACAATFGATMSAPQTARAADCGDIRYQGRTLWLSAGGVSCARGRVLLRRYMDRGTVPAGFRCTKAYGTPDCWHRRQTSTFIMTTAPH